MSFPHSYRVQWVYSPIDGRIYHSEFHHDAAMDLTGDFENDEQKTAFAEKLCALLNAQSGPNSGWTAIADALPSVSGWRWIEYWMEFGQPHLLRFVNGDGVPPQATHWRFVEPPSSATNRSGNG